ncbi:MAG: chromosome partitioning protein ParB, partial [Rhodococcus sp.]|nr:chromosome partitioning protein ParB [Rhodococcus sp. (in: high G+C Gram-positive bacteria)]
RDIGFAAGTIPFQEFYWGAWVRDTAPVDLTNWNRDDLSSYLGTVKSVTKAQTALTGDAVVDSGFTATDLGVLSAWNDGKAESKGEFAKLSKPYTDDKPGKIAYALAYKATL